MQIEIIAIGNELLSGFTINTNASFISQALLEAGFLVSRHTVLPDDAERLEQGIKEALQRSDLIITTGGLGPTCDDISRHVVAKLFHSDFRYVPEIAEELQKRFGGNFPTIDDQATIPTKATLLKNTVGTAPGFIFRENDSTLIMLPGIPAEMKVMTMNHVIPYLKNTFGSALRSYGKRLNIFGLPEAAIDPLLRKLKDQHSHINFGIYPSQGTVGVHLTVESTDETEAMELLNPSYLEISKEFANHLFESASGRLEEAVHERFIRNKWTLSAAESCTGGSVAARLTQFPGSSKYFLGSIVAYSNALKTEFLGVPEELLKEKGAVSEEAVRAMLSGLFERTKSDFGIAVSGIAGPSGGTPEKPVGTVWCAVGKRDEETHVWKFIAHGNREMIIDRSVNALLGKLLRISR